MKIKTLKLRFLKRLTAQVLDNTGSYDTSKEECRVPQYMRMQRTGNTITLSVSDDGKDWTNNPRQPQSIEIPGLSDTIYVGIATDSIQGVPVKDYFSQAKVQQYNFKWKYGRIE